jgi:hypothetical protein
LKKVLFCKSDTFNQPNIPLYIKRTFENITKQRIWKTCQMTPSLFICIQFIFRRCLVLTVILQWCWHRNFFKNTTDVVGQSTCNFSESVIASNMCWWLGCLWSHLLSRIQMLIVLIVVVDVFIAMTLNIQWKSSSKPS